jgi:hypothetical protein
MPHQTAAVPEMVRGDFMLVWDPGTGKTYPVIRAAERCGYPHLTICPAHLRDQWAEQVARFTPQAVVRVLDKTKEPAALDGADFVICSYEYVTATEGKGKTRIPKRWKELRRHKWASMAWDEAHALMNEEAARTRALLGASPESTSGLAFAADRVWPLTGTPFTFPNQIYPIVSRLFPRATRRDGQSGYMTAREWENRFCRTAPVEDPRTGRSFGEKIVGAKNIPDLRRRLAPYLSKVKLQDIHDRGETIDTLTVRGDLRGLLKGLEPEVLDQYEALNRVLSAEEIPEAEKLAALEESGLVMAQLRHHIAVAKIQATTDILALERAKGVDKILVFGWHKEPLKTLAAKHKAPLIYGTPMTARQKKAALETFLDDPSCNYLFGQIGAVGTGTDGIQDVCRRSFFHEASWTYRDNKQARHRTFRKGQRHDVHTSFIVLKGSVDEHVARVLARNAETVSRVLD